MDKGRLSRTLRANNGNDREGDVVVKPFGYQSEGLWVIVDKRCRYLPNVVEIVDKT